MEKQASGKGGFSYYVSDGQLAVFQRLSPLQRLKWVEDARLFTLLARTPETEIYQERLRMGKTITQ